VFNRVQWTLVLNADRTATLSVVQTEACGIDGTLTTGVRAWSATDAAITLAASYGPCAITGPVAPCTTDIGDSTCSTSAAQTLSIASDGTLGWPEAGFPLVRQP
jgi:hypothetical protein